MSQETRGIRIELLGPALSGKGSPCLGQAVGQSSHL